LYGIILILVVPVLFLPLYPPTQWDATSYHLAAAKIYAKSHAIVFTPYLRYPVFPQVNEMLFTSMLLLYDDISAQLVQFLMMLVVAIALYAWGRRVYRARVGLWGAVLWLSNPLVLWLGASAYVDIGLATFVVLATYGLLNWFQSRSTSWLVLSAVLFGFASGSKYLALFPLAGFGLFLLYLAVRERTLRELITFAVIVMVVASPWYIRNAYYTGNPIWPYLGSKLGYAIWSSEDAKAQFSEQGFWGAGKGPVAFLLLPWNLTVHESVFHAESPLSPIYLFLLPLCLLGATRNAHLRILLITVGLYTMFWFGTVQVLRYLLPAVPLLSLAGAAALEECVFRFQRTQTPAGARVLTGVICVLLLVPGWTRAAALMPRSLPPATPEERASYLRQSLPLYSAYEFLNRIKGDNYTLYVLLGANMKYFADGRFMGDWFGPARYSLLLNRLSQPQRLYEELRRLKANYLVVPQPLSRKDIEDSARILGANYLLVPQPLSRKDAEDPVFAPGFLEDHLKLIYASSHVLLFEVEDRVVQLDESPELLKNTGFEALSAGVPMSWLAVGKPLTDNTGTNSHDGKAAVRSDGNDWLLQAVPVEGGGIYFLRNFTRAAGPAQFARLQINWLDRERKLVTTDIEVVAEEPDWRSHTMAARAPANASWAEVYASVDDDSKAWFDDFSLVQLKYK
jgi:4-amino-4-deoxy-L-arabinose transferase-like glycosyltransferase